MKNHYHDVKNIFLNVHEFLHQHKGYKVIQIKFLISETGIHQSRLCVCQVRSALLRVSSFRSSSREMRLCVCQEMRLCVCQEMR